MIWWQWLLLSVAHLCFVFLMICWALDCVESTAATNYEHLKKDISEARSVMLGGFDSIAKWVDKIYVRIGGTDVRIGVIDTRIADLVSKISETKQDTRPSLSLGQVYPSEDRTHHVHITHLNGNGSYDGFNLSTYDTHQYDCHGRYLGPSRTAEGKSLDVTCPLKNPLK